MGNRKGRTYYEILDVPADATPEEVEQAYRRARATYGEDSVALYSLYSSEEKEEILREMKKAYETLRDEAKRAAYDAAMAASEGVKSYLGASTGPSDAGATTGTPGGPSILSECAPLILRLPLHSADSVDPVAAEQYRVLYTKLESISTKHSYKVFAITSAVKGEGKTVTTLNLANVIASDFKKKVVILECDFKKPSMLEYFSKPEINVDIADVISGRADLRDAIRRVEESGLYLIPAQKAVKNSSELLDSSGIRKLVEYLRGEFDYVLVDSPPILHLSDMNIISRFVDGLILVVRAKKTPKDLVLKAARSFGGGEIMGIVLNDAEVSYNRYYYR